jgi:hypothetical protein
LGREREVQEISGLLGRAAVRLLTLTGPGGIGKTRLGIETARTAEGHFPDGVAFVALASLSDEALVIPSVLRVLGSREAAGVVPMEVLSWSLREKKILLVLDNFEHLAEAAPTVADLVGACSNLCVLVTSRTSLRLRGEHEYPISPLAMPDPARSPVAEEGAHAPAARFGWALRMYWLLRARQGEGRLLIEQTLERAEDLPAQARARVLNALAVCMYGSGDAGRLVEISEESAALFRQAGDVHGAAHAPGMIGFAMLEMGDFDGATRVFAEVLENLKEQGTPGPPPTS